MRIFGRSIIFNGYWINLLILLSSPAAAQQSDSLKILFVGSSSTYCHDLPLQVSHWLNRYGGWKSKAFLTGKSGTGFHEYLRPGFKAQYGLAENQTLLEKIEVEKLSYIVIQQITYFMGEKDSAEIVEQTEKMCEAIRTSGATPVFYEMGWRLGRENEVGRAKILEEAKRNDIAIYVPCSRAWARVRSERPDIELHNLPDTDHPGTLGNYLNMCCFYAAFTGISPVGLPPKASAWPRFGSFDKDIAKAKLTTAQLDYYHKVMPEWMQMISIMANEVSVDKKTARYLQEVSWKVHRETQRALKKK